MTFQSDGPVAWAVVRSQSKASGLQVGVECSLRSAAQMQALMVTANPPLQMLLINQHLIEALRAMLMDAR